MNHLSKSIFFNEREPMGFAKNFAKMISVSVGDLAAHFKLSQLDRRSSEIRPQWNLATPHIILTIFEIARNSLNSEISVR